MLCSVAAFDHQADIDRRDWSCRDYVEVGPDASNNSRSARLLLEPLMYLPIETVEMPARLLMRNRKLCLMGKYT